MKMYPLIRRDDRKLPEDYSGFVVTCDVDKTYLDTDFRSLGGLLTIPLEWAEDKETVAGMGPLLKALRHGTKNHNQQVPFYFITASPPLLSRALTRKALLDGVQHDGATFKDWRTILLRFRRPGWLRRQLAYKLCALCHQRGRLPPLAREILIGDDAESDAWAYSIYADALSQRISMEEVREILDRRGFDEQETRYVEEALAGLRSGSDRVERIYILMATGTSAEDYNDFGPALVPVLSSFQLAAHLAATGVVHSKAVLETGKDRMRRSAATRASLTGELMDGAARGLVHEEALRLLYPALVEEGVVQQVAAFRSHVRPAPRRKVTRLRVTPG